MESERELSEPVSDLGYRVECHRYCSEKLIEAANDVGKRYGSEENVDAFLVAYAIRQILLEVAQAELAVSVSLLETGIEGVAA